MKIFILAAFALSTSAYMLDRINSTCPEDLIKAQGEITAFAASIQNDVSHPDLGILKDLLSTITSTLLDCKGIQYDLTVYDVCVDKSQPVFDYIVKILADIQNGDFGALQLNALELAAFIGSTLIPCINKPNQFAKIF